LAIQKLFIPYTIFPFTLYLFIKEEEFMRSRLSRISWYMLVGWLLFAAMPMALAATDKAVLEAAQSWLALMDSGKYTEAWKAAAPLVQQKITEQEWVKINKEVVDKMGKIQSRKLLEEVNLKEMIGATPGDYVVILYSTAFQKMPQGFYEKLTLAKVDGKWKVFGYLIK
jgi:hypothetical protein